VVGLSRHFAALRWRLLLGSLRGDGSDRIGVIASTVLSAFIGVVGAAGLAAAGRTVADPTTLFVLVGVLGALAVAALGTVAGISQPIDPRVLAIEPLTEGERAAGLLTATAVGPPGLAGMAVGAGLVIGAARGPASLLVVVPAVTVWLLMLLVLARSVTNVLALVVNRAPRFGQVLMGLGGLAFYVILQLAPPAVARLGAERRARLTEVLSWTPMGQLGRSLSSVETSLGVAVVHLVVGAAALPVLGLLYVHTTSRLTHSVSRQPNRLVTSPRPGQRGVRALVRRACGRGPRGAVAWRSIVTRFRTPRTAIETFLGGGIGLAAVLAPALLREEAGSGAVLVGGAVQLAVLFMAGNSFGNDGAAIADELLTGASARTLVWGKARSIAVVAAPVAVIGPLIAASVTGEWRFLLAGLLVGFGGLLAGTGGAIVQSTFVPIAMPDSDNPFAHGESGRGVLSALLLLAVLVALTLFTLPLFLALFWANAFGSVAWVTLFGALTVGVGWGVMRGAIELSARHVSRRGPEFVRAVTPAH
jgi:hypothetical protein